MKTAPWDVDDAKLLANTGKPLTHWKHLLDRSDAGTQKSHDVVGVMQGEHAAARPGTHADGP